MKVLDVKGILTIIIAAAILAAVGYALDFNELKGEVSIIKTHYLEINRRLERIENILLNGN